MTCAEVLREAGITAEIPDYGLQYNLCHAAMFGGLGIRVGSAPSVKTVLHGRKLAELNDGKVLGLALLLERLNAA